MYVVWFAQTGAHGAQAKPRGAWVQEKRQFRWELSDLSPGASLVVRVAFLPVPKQADIGQGCQVSFPGHICL